MKKLINFFLACILVSSAFLSEAQQVKIDSLQNLLKILNDDTIKVKTLNKLCSQFINTGNYEKALQYAKEGELLAKKLNYQKEIAISYTYFGFIYMNQGNYEKALEYYLKNLKIMEETANKQGIAASSNNIALIYYYQQNYEKALVNYLKSLKIFEEIGNKQGLASSYCNIGLIYEEQGDYKKALDNQLKSLKICEEIKDKSGIAGAYTNVGILYEKQGDYKKALDNQLKSLKMKEEIGNKQGIGRSFNNIGSVYFKLGKFKESYDYLSQSLNIDKEIGYKNGIKEAYSSLSELFEEKGDYQQAYNYHKLYSDIKDTLLNEQSSKQIAEMNTKYDSEKKDKELIQKTAEINKQRAETEKQDIKLNAFIIGFILVLILAFFIFRSYRQKQNANKLLEEKNILIENQKQLVEEKNLKITDSINYAKRIQQAILPPLELINSFLPESFIFFRPKDIVSGDFYWFAEKEEKLLIAVADCTGHGVPGAFMSMIGNTSLNEIVNVKNIVSPAQILNELNKNIVGLLHQSSGESGTQDDGMDITILSIDIVNREIEFAGANHFSYLINNFQLQTLQGDVYSIGGMFGRSDINFTSQKIKVEKGSIIYLFSDGFIDQFGGEKNTKFLSGRFGELLKSIQQYDMQQQQIKLVEAFDNWKGNNKQLDDVLIVGVKI